jgi:ABC-type bacteriocin/lantibiotic exporter with double-glycine peptidase domain
MCAEAVGGLLVLSVLIYGAILVSNKHMLLGQMIAAYSLLASTVIPITRLVDAQIAVQGASLAAARLIEFTDAKAEDIGGSSAFVLRAGVAIRGLTFAWPRGQLLLKNINLDIPCGRVTGLRGASGSGKSTLVRLVQRLYEPAGGAILVDGVDCRDINLEEYRRGIAVVSSATKIFNLSLGENILLGRYGRDSDGASVPLVIPAELVREGVIRNFLERFPGGLSTPIGEKGRELSTGERQIVGLLRALAGEPRLLILDEGLSALDANLAQSATDLIKLYARGHAVLVIAHDHRSLIESDHIYALENGEITDEGTGGASFKTVQDGSGYCEIPQAVG